jgi:nucleoside phosphorylase
LFANKAKVFEALPSEAEQIRQGGGMKLDDPSEILAKADAQGLRRALIVTALPLEMKAVRVYLKDLGSCVARDGNVFEFGQFSGTGHEWLVVVAESGAGNHASQGIVTTAITQFGPFELLLFIGVAASRKKADAPIGSVVVSNHVYLASVGKYESGEFYARSREFPSNPRLIGLGRKVARDERWHERLMPPYGGISPADGQYPKPFPPGAVIAPIVSVEAVSADSNSVLEQQITRTYQDATALEMEGYGALFAAHSEGVPSIVIRGISDIREGKDTALDRIHQPIAAAHGAAFGFELLDVWGQNLPGSTRTPIVVPPAPTDPPPTASPESQAKPGQITLVLNFAGSPDDYPPEKQERIVEALREITGNPTLQIVGSEEGSFHLFLKVNAGDADKIDRQEVYRTLQQKLEAELLGVMTEADYRSARAEQSALAVASAPLLDWPQTLPDGTSIERPELQQLLSVLEKAEGSTTVLLGAPGSGKTALLAKFAQALQSDGISFLAIKADFLDPAVANEDELRRFLGLSETVSSMVRKLSLVRPVALIIDQLDALADYVDLRTGRLSVLLNIVRKLGSLHNVHVVLSARTFEFEHDARLKSVRAESITLELPPWSAVLQILNTHKIRAEGWPADAQQVMRSPQALSTFLKLASPAETPPFPTYQAMLEKLWHERVLSRANGGRIAKLAGTIAEDMAERETLWIASARYDEQANDLASLVAEGILTHPFNAGSIGFSHQTVFEFALARAFAQKEGRLSSYVLERESSLFVRPKLWAALSYLRGVEQPTYETELKAIWTRPQLRLHLRYLLIEFLGQQATPSEAEVVFFEAALSSNNRQAALQAMVGSPGWFARLKHTAIASAMSDPKEANVVSGILARACTFAPDAVVEMIESRWLPNKDFDGLTWHVLQECPAWTEKNLEIASLIVQRSPISSWVFDYTLSTIGAERAVIAMKLALARLRAELAEAVREADRRAALPLEEGEDPLSRYMRSSPSEPLTKLVEQSDGWDALEALAKTDAANFLAILWPWFQEVLRQLRRFKDDVEDKAFPVRYALDFRFEEEDSLKLGEHPLLGALRAAAETLAAQEGDAFVKWLSSVQSEEAEPAQRLFAHALATQPERYANTALNFLITDKRRFQLGNIEDYSGTTKRLVKAVSPNWDDKQLGSFVSEVRSYAPRPGPWRDAKSRQYFYRDTDRVKVELLDLIPQDRLSNEVRDFLQDQHRRFGESKRGTTFSGPEWIGSPMSTKEITKASDDDVINAFRELPDATGWDNPKTWMKGGNVQLSRAFAEFAKTNPARAAEIIERFNPEIGARAAGYAIDAMAEEGDPALILGLITQLEKRGFSGEEYRGSAASAIERLLKREVSIDDAMVAIIISWLSAPPSEPVTTDAAGSEDDDDDSLEAKKSSDEAATNKEREDSVLWGMGGISILPHGNFPILEVLTRILLQRHDYKTLLDLLTAHLDRSESQKLWSSLLRFFNFIRPDDKTQLVEFLTKLFAKYPGLATTREAAMFLAHVHWIVPDFVRHVLSQWKAHEAPLVQQAYGELVTLIRLMQPKLEWPALLVEEIMTQTSTYARTGAAYAAVHVWAETENSEAASSLLQRIIKSADDRTWSAVVDLFRIVDEISPEPAWIKVLEAIAEQIPQRRSVNSTFVVQRLQTLLPHHATLVANIAKALVEKWRKDLADMRTGTASIAPELVDIAITVHRLGPETRDQGTELFESLLDINAYTARETLDQIDNRFRSTAPTSRRRLPRRNRSRPKRVRRAG